MNLISLMVHDCWEKIVTMLQWKLPNWLTKKWQEGISTSYTPSINCIIFLKQCLWINISLIYNKDFIVLLYITVDTLYHCSIINNIVSCIFFRAIYPIHSKFRIVAIGEHIAQQINNTKGDWLNPEVLSMFQYIHVTSLPQYEERQLLLQKVYTTMVTLYYMVYYFRFQTCHQIFLINY